MRRCSQALIGIVLVLIGADRYSDFTEFQDPLAAAIPQSVYSQSGQPDRVFRQRVASDTGLEAPFSTMVLKKWNKVYVRTGSDSGIVMLLVEKLIPTDSKEIGRAHV